MKPALKRLASRHHPLSFRPGCLCVWNEGERGEEVVRDTYSKYTRREGSGDDEACVPRRAMMPNGCGEWLGLLRTHTAALSQTRQKHNRPKGPLLLQMKLLLLLLRLTPPAVPAPTPTLLPIMLEACWRPFLAQEFECYSLCKLSVCFVLPLVCLADPLPSLFFTTIHRAKLPSSGRQVSVVVITDTTGSSARLLLLLPSRLTTLPTWPFPCAVA